MVGFLRAVGIIILVLSILPLPVLSIDLINSSGQLSPAPWIVLIGGILTGVSWLALAKVIELLEKINQNLSDRKNPE